jgi:hypothetical protein
MLYKVYEVVYHYILINKENMPKSAQTKKKEVKKSTATKKMTQKAMPMASKPKSRKAESIWEKQFLMEHQKRLHKENPALKSLLYILLVGLIVLIALLFIQGQSVGMW